MKTISREMRKFLNKRQESNIQFIIHALLAMKIFRSFSYSVTNASDTAGSNILQIQFLYLDRNNQVGSCREVKCW